VPGRSHGYPSGAILALAARPGNVTGSGDALDLGYLAAGKPQCLVVPAYGLLVRPFQDAVHLAFEVVVQLNLAHAELVVFMFFVSSAICARASSGKTGAAAARCGSLDSRLRVPRRRLA
jgi:hypothetical protein